MFVSPQGNRLAFIGSHGYVHIVDAASKQWILDIKMNSTLKSLSFLNDTYCVTSGFDSEICLWDLRYHNGKCLSKFSHEDGQPTSFVSSYIPPSSSSSSTSSFYSLPNAYLSIGSTSGVNSIFEGNYDNEKGSYNFENQYSSASPIASVYPKPLKSVMNITTRITSSSFHPSGQILAIASKEVRSCLCFLCFFTFFSFLFFDFRKKIF
jgi:hypothetical protein